MKIPKYFLLFVLLSGCLTTSNQLLETREPIYPTNRDYSADFNTVWDATIKAVSDLPITVIEKDSGIIQTDWTQYLDSTKVSVYRGLLYGGQTEDSMPVEVMHRFNILVSQKSQDLTNVKITRYVKIRPYERMVGPVGSWRPNTLGSFEQTVSDTRQENKLLNEIGNLLKRIPKGPT